MQLGATRKNRKMWKAAVLAAASSLAIGCGSIDIEQILALSETADNTIAVRNDALPPPLNDVSTTVEGGVETTISVDLVDLFSLGGIPAGISVDRILIAGRPIVFAPGALRTGRICLSRDELDPGGGLALIQLFRENLAVTLALNTIVYVEDGIGLSNFDPLPFGAVVEDDVPTSLSDLLGLFLGGGGGGGLELTQTITDTLPPDIPLLGGATLSATLTLASVDVFPTSNRLTFCEGFIPAP